ncbi:DUF6583 family protein [Virgibacillus sp. YIM 98842]|jgi:hypothetical protein|uniref:DUF6583 family protein n=1 Tax=Virgibacillus sp. YIM 98842 TaxID=2663533 RepID=UPI0013D94B4E|nr:DUF6583 family protein [Virgibacillus sp. YIM 98842]
MEEAKKSTPKGLIAIIIAAVVVIGGGAAALMLVNVGEKEKYFLAEKNTVEFMVESFENRYEPEMNWLEHTEENVTESTVEVSAEYNDPASQPGTMGMDPSQLINNSTLTIKGATDMENQEMTAEILANIAGMEIDGIEFYLTSDRILFGLPFLEEAMQLMDEDFGPLMHEFDPENFTGEETLGLESIFDGTGGFLSEEDLEHFKVEYFEMVYDELPDSAFSSEEEATQILGESVDTEKITLHLKEDEIKNIFSQILAKMQEDERLKEILRDHFNSQLFAADPMMEQQIDMIMEEFNSGLADAEADVEELYIPDGLTSTLWLENDLVKKRDFEFAIGTSEDDLVGLHVAGEQLLDTASQSLDYNFSFSDPIDEGTMNLSGEFTSEDDQIEDTVTLNIADTVLLNYNGSETLEEDTRNFERTFSIEDEFGPGGSIIWSGASTYDNDQMNSEHNVSFDSPEIDQDMFALFLTIDSQTIDSIEIPAADDARDLGSMNAGELTNYFEMEVAPQFQQWLFGIMAGSGDFGL